MKQNPFSLYDFLGYVFPGALALMLIAFFQQLSSLEGTTDGYIKAIDFLKGQNKSGTLGVVEETVIVTIISYVLGHIVAYLSSITVEQFSKWTYGYPSEFLLKKVSTWHYFSSISFRSDNSNPNEEKWCFAYKGTMDLVWRLMVAILLLPITICTFVFGKCLQMRSFFVKTLDKTLRKSIEANMEKLSKSLGITRYDGDDFHRIIYHYEYERLGNHVVKLDNYVALYGFLRGLTFIANVATMWIFCYYCIPSLNLHAPIDWHLVLLLCISTGVTYVFFMAFMKFYRRFTLEGFMCLVIDNSFKETKVVPFTYIPTSDPIPQGESNLISNPYSQSNTLTSTADTIDGTNSTELLSQVESIGTEEC